MYDYFYSAEAEQFSFYRIPKVLFTEERFRSVSAEAKVLYGLLLDRMSLSCKNGWLDQAGRVYIIFTIDEVMTALGCADQKAGKLLHELESKWRGGHDKLSNRDLLRMAIDAALEKKPKDFDALLPF